MDEEIDLADVPPEAFVAARDAAATRLREEGRVAEAAAVKRLRKPTVTQWLVDQVRRHHADDVAALRNAAHAVAEAQEAAITRNDRDALQQANATRRQALRAAERAVAETIARNGRPDHYRAEVLAMIESAVIAEAAPGTFGLRDDLELPATPEAEPPAPARDVERERLVAEAEAAVRSAEQRVDRAREELAEEQSRLAAAEARLREVRGGAGRRR